MVIYNTYTPYSSEFLKSFKIRDLICFFKKALEC